MNFFEEATLRLKQQLAVTQDKEVAHFLGLSPRAWAGRKQGSTFPEKELRALAQQRPELGIDVEYVLTGGTLSQHQRLSQDKAYEFTRAMDVLPEDKAHLLDLLDRSGMTMARSNASRARVYEDITEVLRLCSDDTVELALKLVVKLYRAELAENNSTRGGVMKGEI